MERQLQVVERQAQVLERRSGQFRLNLTTVRCEMQPSQIIADTDYQKKTKDFRCRNILDDRLCVDQFGLGLTQINPSLTKICAKNDFFYNFVHSDLDLLTFGTQICTPGFSCPALCFD